MIMLFWGNPSISQIENDLYSFMNLCGRHAAAAGYPVSKEFHDFLDFDFLESKSTSAQSLTEHPVVASAFL